MTDFFIFFLSDSNARTGAYLLLKGEMGLILFSEVNIKIWKSLHMSQAPAHLSKCRDNS